MAQMKTRISRTFGWVDLVVIATTMTLQMCAEAVKAEANRKARQHKLEIDLPTFPEHDITKLLNKKPQYLEERGRDSSLL